MFYKQYNMEICFHTKYWTVELSVGIFLSFSFLFLSFFCGIVIQLQRVCIFSLTLFTKLYTKKFARTVVLYDQT